MPSPDGATAADTIRVVGAVARRRDRVFLARRPPGGRHGGLWEFPGGKVEPGEDDRAALRRELREELAVDSQIGALIAVGRDGRVELWCYAVDLLGEPDPLEATEVGWFSRNELRDLPIPPADRPALERVLFALGAHGGA